MVLAEVPYDVRSVRALNNGSGERLRVSLAGIRASLSSALSEFMEYANAASGAAAQRSRTSRYRSRRRSPGTNAARRSIGAPPIRISRRWIASTATSTATAARSPGSASTSCRSLHLRFAWTGAACASHGDYYLCLSQNSYRDWLTRGLRRRHLSRLRRRRFTTLLYYLLYYPCFWVVGAHERSASDPRRRRGAATARRGDGRPERRRQVDAGRRPGRRSDARLLSDTFLLHNGAAVCAVPEPLLLDHGASAGSAIAAEAAARSAIATACPQRFPLAGRAQRAGGVTPAGVPAARDDALHPAADPEQRARPVQREQPHRQRPAPLLGVRVGARAARSEAAGIGARAEPGGIGEHRAGLRGGPDRRRAAGGDGGADRPSAGATATLAAPQAPAGVVSAHASNSHPFRVLRIPRLSAPNHCPLPRYCGRGRG